MITANKICFTVRSSRKMRFAIYKVIPVLLPRIGFACSVVVFVIYSYGICWLRR